MQADLRSRRKTMHDHIGVEVAEQQRRLKKNQTNGPYRRRATEPRQDLLGNDGLDQKKQERAEKDGEGVKGHRDRVVDFSGRQRRFSHRLAATLAPKRPRLPSK